MEYLGVSDSYHGSRLWDYRSQCSRFTACAHFSFLSCMSSVLGDTTKAVVLCQYEAVSLSDPI